MKLSEIAAFFRRKMNYEADISAISIDSREVPKNCLFFAIIGENFDGHSFVSEALEAGAVAAVVDRQCEGDPEKLIFVDSTKEAFVSLAGYYRDKFQIDVVGVTGSVGKTTTKDMIYAALSESSLTLRNEGNLNNEIGLPKTLFGLNNDFRFAVLEMGMSNLGEIRLLTKAAKPKIAVITNIGVAHLENLKTRENILKAKLEIVEGLTTDGTLLLNLDDSYLKGAKDSIACDVKTYSVGDGEADYFAYDIKNEIDHTTFMLRTNGIDHNIRIPAVGIHNVGNAVAAFAVGDLLGLPTEKTIKGLSKYEPSGMRQKIGPAGEMWFIEDCYNASPDSMKAALTVLRDFPADGRKIAVLGDMLELGEEAEQMHFDVGVFARDHADYVYTTGDLGLYIARGAATISRYLKTKKELIKELKKDLEPGDVVLFKASRGVELEEVVNALREGLTK